MVYAAKLTTADGSAKDEFGQSVAVSGELILVGAPWDDEAGVQTGLACTADISGLATYNENAAPLALDGKFTVSVIDSINLTGATIQITRNYTACEDILSVTPLPEA